ncbi:MULTISPECIES: polysaccharide lyase 8 family protein [unclassified Sphingomonas]|uniref:polysaccharide lyase 8 family protein n=1 Tax=unclassified Sphingomonas TaxID=196159 RepID=UPI0026CC320F
MAGQFSRREIVGGSASGAALLASGALPQQVLAQTAPALTAGEFTALRARYVTMVTGGTNGTVLYDDFIAGIAAEATSLSASFSTANARLWQDLDAERDNGLLLMSIARRVQVLALAYFMDRSSKKGDPTIKAQVDAGLQRIAQNFYNTSATRSTYGWYSLEIGTPLALLETILMLDGQLNQSVVNTLLAAVQLYTSDPLREQGLWPSNDSNRVWKAYNCLVHGLYIAKTDLVAGREKVAAAKNALATTFVYATPSIGGGEGFYADGSYIGHGDYAYTGGYGLSQFQFSAQIVYLLSGSSAQFTLEEWTNLRNFAYASFEPLMYRGHLMDTVRGREVARSFQSDHAAGHRLVTALAALAQVASATDAFNFRSMVRYWVKADKSRDIYAYYSDNRVSLHYIRLVKAIEDPLTGAEWGDRFAHYQFPAMGRAVHKRTNFALALATYSNRRANYEALGNENRKGWYTASGMVYLYTPTNLAHYKDDFWPTVDAYRLPGTTIDKRPRTPNEGTGTRGLPMVGGAYSSASGVMCMDFSADAGQLVAKKAWFMFGDLILCAGAGITATSTNRVETIIENRNIGADGTNPVLVNNTPRLTTLGDMTSQNPEQLAAGITATDNWVHIDGVGGYFIPRGNPAIRGLRETRRGTWYDIALLGRSPLDTRTRRYVTLWLDHGVMPTGANSQYAYVMLPGATSGTTEFYAANPNFQLLENSTQAQCAVQFGSTTALYAAIFWQNVSKSVDVFTCNAQAAVFVRRNANVMEVAISDPTQLRTTPISLTLRLTTSGDRIDNDPAITVVSRSAGSVTISFNPTNTNGESRRVRFPY